MVSFPTPVVAANLASFSVTAEDKFGQTALTDNDVITFASTDSAAVLPASGQLQAGTGRFLGALATAGTWSLSAIDAALAVLGTESNIVVLTDTPGDVTSKVQISATALVFSHATLRSTTTLTITNTSSTAISGPLELVVTGLPAGVTLANESGTTAGGSPYILMAPATLIGPGQSITVLLSFSNPSGSLFSYGAGLYSWA